MRATQTTTYRSLQSFLDRTSDRLQELQLAAATGKKLNRPSDDPTAISPVLSARTQIMASDRYIETIESGLDRIENMDGYFDSIENTLVRAKEIGIAAINGSLSAADMETYADEISQLRDSLLADANAQVDGKYLFAGFAEEDPPFTVNPNYPNLAPSAIAVPVLNDPTDTASLIDGGGIPVAQLVVPGEGTWDVDAVNGLTFTPEAGFDGTASPVDYTLTDSAAVTTGPFEATAYYHDSPVIYNGDAGALEFEIAPNELINVNTNGNTLMLGDTDNDGVVDVNGIDIFAVMATLEENLRAGDTAALEQSLDDLESAANQVRGQRSLKGNIGRRLETAESHMEKIKIDMEAFRSRFEDADILETITELQQQQQSFEAALNVTGKVSELSILNYL